jgi:hypothetical protein
MGNLVTIRSSESVHWYQADGTPRHDATLREARKEHLYPSVTSVLDLKRKPGLDNWKLSQLLSQALTMTREPTETDEQYISRIVAADAEERSHAPDLGTEVHQQLADYIMGREEFPRLPDVDLGPVLDWIDKHARKIPFGGKTEVRFSCGDGFAGCVDYIGAVDGESALIDWKTQGVKDKPAFYPEWCWQLSAYAAGIQASESALYSVIIDTNQPGCYAKRWTEAEQRRGWSGFLGLLAAWCADRNYWPTTPVD